MNIEKAKERLEISRRSHEQAKLKFLDRVFGPKILAKELNITEKSARRNLELYFNYKAQIFGYGADYVTHQMVTYFDFDSYLEDFKEFVDLNFKDAMKIALRYDENVKIYAFNEGYLGLFGLENHTVSEADAKQLNDLGFKTHNHYWLSSKYLYRPAFKS